MRNSPDENDDGALLNTGVDFGLVLVVIAAPIDRIVVSRIAERAGYRTVSRTPDEMVLTEPGDVPALIILDSGADGEALIERIAPLRRPAGRWHAPLLILLGNAGPLARQVAGSGIGAAVVAKPITPDRLQPIIREMMDRLKG